MEAPAEPPRVHPRRPQFPTEWHHAPVPAASGPRSSRLRLIDAAIHRFLVARSLMLLRCSVGGVFLYFGTLKLFPGLSPAEDLVMRTVDILTLGLVPGRPAVLFTGVVECALGLLLLTGRQLTVAIFALGLELFGILAPLVLLPGRLFDGPFLSPTLEGQYVLKDLTLVAAGMVLACTIRGGRLVRGARTAQPTERTNGAGSFSAEDKLRILLGSVRDERAFADVAAEHGILPDDLVRWRNEALDGATASMAPPGRPGEDMRLRR